MKWNEEKQFAKNIETIFYSVQGVKITGSGSGTLNCRSKALISLAHITVARITLARICVAHISITGFTTKRLNIALQLYLVIELD